MFDHDEAATPRTIPYSLPTPEFLPPRPGRARVAVFGGSFNPVHNGHLFLAGEILRRGLAAEVLFIPAGIPPHKPCTGLAPVEHRLAMLQAALAPYPAFSFSDIEARKTDQPSYTIQTLETLTLAYPENDLFFVMGMDCLTELHTWHKAQDLVNAFQFLIYPRSGFAMPKLPALTDQFGPKGAVKLRNAVVDDLPLLPVSASGVRAACAAGRSLAGLVPETVAGYIRTHHLFDHP